MAKRRAMLLLTYNVGAHVNKAEYEQWIRDVDNPFFNRIPGIVRYSNWKVVEEKVGKVAFSYYDLMEIEDLGAFEKVWGNKELQKFAHGWTERWSVHGTDEKYVGFNFQVLLGEEFAAPDRPEKG
jgi:hypothetical protein